MHEHVANYDEMLHKIRGVLKADGISIRIFPSRDTLVAPHVYVPLQRLFSQ